MSYELWVIQIGPNNYKVITLDNQLYTLIDLRVKYKIWYNLEKNITFMLNVWHSVHLEFALKSFNFCLSNFQRII